MNCKMCGHSIQPERRDPLPDMDVAPPGSDGGSDGKVLLCVKECFCSFGGCDPEEVPAAR